MTIPVQLDIEGPAFAQAVPDQGAWPFQGLVPAYYRCIVADPPWHFKARSKKGDGRAPKYPRMSLADIKALPVADLADRDCVLLLWAVDPMLPQALEVMKAWGFTYKTVGFYWAKTTRRSWTSWTPNWMMGLGYWTRANPEMCLLGVRGAPSRISASVPRLIVEPVREHSRKPEQFYSRTEELVSGPRCELFSRATRPGWSGWGLDHGQFDEVAA